MLTISRRKKIANKDRIRKISFEVQVQNRSGEIIMYCTPAHARFLVANSMAYFINARKPAILRLKRNI